MTKKPTAQPASDAPSSGSDDEIRFEEALTQVEAIIEQIESGEIGLEDAIGKYEQGVGLIERCRAVLAQAELRVSDLTQRMTSSNDSPGADARGEPAQNED